MTKTYMSHLSVSKLLRDGMDIKGWVDKDAPLWHSVTRRMWRHMWFRCYDPENISYKYYIDSIIHDDFRYLSNFVKWIESQPNFEEFKNTCHEVTWTIDKDMKCKGNKHYFPEYMTLCTREENLKERNARCGSLNPPKPIIGINKHSILLFKSLTEATEKGFKQGSISNCFSKRQKSHGGYKWFRINYKHSKKFRKISRK